MRKIYLDYAATTPMDRKVLASMKPYFSEKFGNPMSLHSFGQVAADAISQSRKTVAEFLGCAENEIIFTSGATESNNLAVKGVVRKYFIDNPKAEKPHIITTMFEHHCVLHACEMLENEGLAEVTYLPVNKDGVVKVSDLNKAIKMNTILVSIMFVNNEIGTVQPIPEMGKFLKKIRSNSKFKIQDSRFFPLFHTDATQAVNYFDCNVEKLGVDLLSLSGHKIYGPKGVGALYVRKGTAISAIIDGGGQEWGQRSGTHNVPGIVGLATAIQQVKSSKFKVKSLMELRDYFIKKVLKEIPGTYLNGSMIKRSPNNINLRFDNIEGEALILLLDSFGIAASTGSACSTGSLKPSHVLIAIGIKPEQAHGSLRITLGKYTTKKEIDYSISKLKFSVNKIRNISGNILKEFNS